MNASPSVSVCRFSRSAGMAGLVLLLALVAGCADDVPQTAAEADELVKGVRYCSERFDCNTACACVAGTCRPDGFGPPPDDPGYCARPPVRACAAAADCLDGCGCVGGTCRPSAAGPPADDCSLPPPDQYEFDDGAAIAGSYLGEPQVHTFHDRVDEDWIWVYIAAAGSVTFDTAESRGTYMELYRFVGATWPPTEASFVYVAANDDKCGIWWAPYCWGSRITTVAPADTLYAVRIVNQAQGTMTAYDQEPPSYVFTVW